jgi:protocatechuate 3,4-dioxygenase beta subunit
MIRKIALVLALSVSLPLVAGTPALLCVAEEGVPLHYAKNCSPREGAVSYVEPSPKPRRYAWVERDMHAVWLGTIPPNATSANLEQWVGTIAFFDWQPPSGDGIVVLTESAKGLGTWELTLDAWWFREGRLSVGVPAGLWSYVVTADGRELHRRTGIDFSKAVRAPRLYRGVPTLFTRGRAVAADGTTPAGFASILADCRTEMCRTQADGTFRCNMPVPESDTICIEHPKFGRARLFLEGRREGFYPGTVRLRPGSSVSVVRPIHLSLPEGTTITLTGGTSPAIKQPLDGLDTVHFDALGPGAYTLLLAGPEALQRKVFPVTVAASDVEVILSVDAFRLTGEIEYGEKALAGATVALTGEQWEGFLETDQSGRFSAELWDRHDYGVMVKSDRFRESYAEMRRATPSDHHWRIVIPSRRIEGVVRDARNDAPIPGAALHIQSEVGETRWSRRIEADEMGAYEISGVAPGTYAIHASAPGYIGAQPVELRVARSDADRTLDFRLARGTQVSVTVADERGARIADALLYAMEPGGNGSYAGQTSADGNAIVAVAENAPKRIFVLTRAGAFGRTTIRAEDAKNGAHVVVPDPVTGLTLEAQTPDGEPVAGVRLMLRYEGEILPDPLLELLARRQGGSLVTDASGQAALPHLPPGRYELATTHNAWTPLQLGSGHAVVRQTFRKGGSPSP